MTTLISPHPSIPSLRSQHSYTSSYSASPGPHDMSYDYPAPRPGFSQGIRRASSDHEIRDRREGFAGGSGERERRGSGGSGTGSPRLGGQAKPFIPASQSYTYQYPSSSSPVNSSQFSGLTASQSHSPPSTNPWAPSISPSQQPFYPGFSPPGFNLPQPQQYFPTPNNHPGAQAQAQANFAAWAAAYQGMMMAAQHQQQQQQQQQGNHPQPHQQGAMFDPTPLYPNSGSAATAGQGIARSVTAPPKLQVGAQAFVPAAQQQPRSAGPVVAPFHPYRRGVGGRKETGGRERDVSGSSISRTGSENGTVLGGLGKFDFESPNPSPEVPQVEKMEMMDDNEELPAPPRAPYARGGSNNPSSESLHSTSSSSKPGGRSRTESVSSVGSAGGRKRIPVPPLLEPVVGLGRKVDEEKGRREVEEKEREKERMQEKEKEQERAKEREREQERERERQAAVEKEKAAQPPTATSANTTPRPPTHKRQSSSTSSVGTVIKPSLSETTSGSANGWKPSPLSQPSSPPVVSPERVPASPTVREEEGRGSVTIERREKEKEKSGGFLRGRLQKALKSDKEKERDKEEKARVIAAATKAEKPLPTPNMTTPVRTTQRSVSGPAAGNGGPMQASQSLPAVLPQQMISPASQSSTQSSTPPVTPPSTTNTAQQQQRLGNRTASNSSFQPSLIEPLGGQAKGKGRSLFNLKNASTDNISISSTVSSASMMIRKMGALGKLARRNSLAGISKIFKDKPKEAEDGIIVEEGGKEKKKKDKKKGGLFSSKSPPAVSSTSHATAESLDEDRALAGLSPAAKLARQHTLKSKSDNGDGIAKSPSWDNNAELRPGQGAALPALGSVIPAGAFASTVGSGAYDEDSLDDSDDESGMGDTVEDMTLRMDGMGGGDDSRASVDSYQNGYSWGNTYRDRYAIPARGILKAVSSYSGDVEFQAPAAPWSARTRSNSTTQAPGSQEPGPMSKVASENDIDGLHPSKHVTIETLSPSPTSFDVSATEREPLSERMHFPYANASLNTSAPALSAINQFGLMNKRSATAPLQKRNLVWAPECAVYHTFHPTEYDRRSEPATCNRLTPQLAQQIKDELNGYKMEEMDVHPSSRIHTHFFV